MHAVVIRNIPPFLHRHLKEDAALHHRSMTRHIVALLEEAIRAKRPGGIIKPERTKYTTTPEFIDRAKREGRN